mmetsp:Transcript_7740/g.14621  ORF Transcript_7740/g.14621 Transcript_7740/m.14621 type:complete len:101 (-) Transcript_7740:2-304(-)
MVSVVKEDDMVDLPFLNSLDVTNQIQNPIEEDYGDYMLSMSSSWSSSSTSSSYSDSQQGGSSSALRLSAGTPPPNKDDNKRGGPTFTSGLNSKSSLLYRV